MPAKIKTSLAAGRERVSYEHDPDWLRYLEAVGKRAAVAANPCPVR